MKWFAVVCISVAVAAVFLLQGDFWHSMIGIMTAVYVCAPVLLFLIVALLIGLKKREVKPWVSKGLTGWGIFVLCLIASLYAGTMYGDWQQGRMFKFVVNVAVPALEKIKSESGKYPESLPADVVAAAPMGSELPTYYAMQGGDGYRFAVSERQSFMAGYVFTSQKKEWEWAWFD